MKTTIEIDDAVLLRAKRLALEQRTSLRALVEMALRRYLEETGELDRPFKLRRCTVAGHGLQPGLDEGDWPAIRALIYEGRGG
jgi:hypothetical protein